VAKQRPSATLNMSKLDAILAARKQQVKVAVSTELLGLRRNGEVDSDDEDDDDDDVMHGASTAQKQSVELLLGRAPNLLASSKVAERKQAIASLEEASLTADQLKPLLRPLLLRFSDDSERCRDGAVGLVSRWQKGCKSAGDVSGMLPFLMPVMVERLGSEKVQEPSEEVRAALVGLMRDVLLQCKELLRPHIHEVGAIALGCCRDTHPEVIKGLCDLLACIGSSMLAPLCKDPTRGGPKAVKPFSQKLLEAVLPHIRHRHAAVRLQVLVALEELLLCGAGQSVETLTGWRLKNNVPIAEFYGKGAPRVNYLADLSRDRSILVRRKLVATVARWVREMDGEDLYEQEVRIMPYLLSGVTDDDDECASLAIREIEKLGEEYLEKNMKDYKERIEYGHEDEARATKAITLAAPKPLPARPPLGARERVRQHFRHLIHPICAELDLWTSTERLQSARLLEVLLAYTEGFVTEFAHQLLPALAKGMDKDTKGLQEVVGRCASQFAQHTEPDEYLPLLISHAATDALNPLTQRIQHLLLIPHLLRGMRPQARVRALRLLTPLLDDTALVTSQHTPLRTAVAATFEAMVAAVHSLRPAAAGEAPSGPPVAERGWAAPLLPRLLYAVAAHAASSPALQPKLVQLGDGLESLEDADEATWTAARDAASALAAPLAALVGGGAGAGAGGAAEPWASCARPLHGTIEIAASNEEEYAALTRRLVEMLGAAYSGGGRRAPAKENGGSGSAAAAEPRRAVAIAEVDDFTDDDDDDDEEEVVKVNVVRSAAAAAPAKQMAAVELDDFEDELD